MAPSSAAFNDHARLNFSPEALGSFTPFQFVLAVDNQVYRDRIAIPMPDGDTLLPGHQIQREIIIANNHPDIAGNVRIELLTDGVSGEQPIGGYLRFTVVDEQGNTLMGDKDHPGNGADPWNSSADLGVFTARGQPALEQGDPWTPGDPGSFKKLTFIIYLLDHADLNSRSSGWARVILRVDTTSVDQP
jgi:hypothetical protein